MTDILMEIVTAIVSKVGEYLVEPSINQARYIFRFNKIVKDLSEAEKQMQSAKEDIEKRVETAKKNDEEIFKTVQDWQDDTRKILEEVQMLNKEIEHNQLKTCFNGWCPNWGSRHQLGRKATKTSIQLKEIIDRGQFERVGCRALLSGEPSAPKDFECCRSTKDAFDKIMEALKNDGTHMVILCGMGGVGKTTLAKAVSKKVTEESIFKEVVMVTVSQTPNLIDIQDQLAELLNLELTEKTEEGRAKRLSSRLSKSNNNLIILDDVWEETNFEENIGVPLSKGCKMLLTTRNQKVYGHKEYQSLIPLNVLKGHEGVALLKRQAGIDDDCAHLDSLATQIARECDGLPLALVTTGRYLRGKKENKTWEVVCEKLKKSKLEDLGNVDSTERGVYASLKLSYDYLRGDKIRLCFLMCSLFPEDFKIPLEDLVRIGVGLDLFKGVSSIEEARGDLHLMVEELKDLSLLLDADEKEFVKMHDIVRDVCLLIASKEENIFMSKLCKDLRQLERKKSWTQYTTISLLENKLKELSIRLECPKLKILLLGGEKQWLYNYDKSKLLKVSDECFEEMKALEVVSLRYADLSLKSLQFLTNLKTLELFGCNLRDISFLAKLNKLEILSFRHCHFDELPIELSELKELRMLDLRGCSELRRIPSNLIRSFSQLEELYMEEDIFEEREVEEKSIETGNARLSEVNYLPCLAVLYLKIHSKCLPKDFAFSKLSRYQIRVNGSIHRYSKSSKALIIADIDATLLTALFKALYHSVECLSLGRVTGCQNILPSIDQKGLKKLNTLEVSHCEDLKCMIDASQLEEENSEFHPSLARLVLSFLPELQCIWKGPMSIHIVNFQSLTDVYVGFCTSLAYLFTLSIARSLGQLKSLSVEGCESLEFLIKIEEGDNGRGEKMLSKLEDLQIEQCSRLEYVFPVFVAAGLIQLKNLEIRDAPELKQIFHGKEENEIAEEGKDIKLPNLKKLKLNKLEKLTRFFPENNHSTLPALEEFQMKECPNLTIKEGVLEEGLRIVEISNNQLCNGILSRLRGGFFQNFEELRITNCGVKEVFQMEGQQHELSLPKLKSLELNHLEELDSFCKGPAHVLRFENLTTLKISGCKKLKHIFSCTLALSLGQLESVEVKDCENLEQVFYLDHEREENVGGGDHKNIMLPKLKKLHLQGLGKLVSFFPEKYDACYRALVEFKVEDCSKLTTTFIVKKSPNLQVVWMRNCSSQLYNEIFSRLRYGFFKKIKELNVEVKEVFQLTQLEHEMSFSNLKNLTSLTITHFNKLKHIFTPIVAQSHLLQLKRLCITECAELEQIIDVKDGEEVGANLLQTLSSIYVEKCHKLRNLFPISIARGFQQLAYLHVIDNSELEQIIDVKDGEEVGANLLQTLSFIRVEKCHKLKNLFPISIARGFQQLEILHVIDNSELEEIFGDNDVIDEKEIQLPRLQNIVLRDLASLTNFCHVDYHFIFPRLNHLTVGRCPKRSTRFSWDEDNDSVHAEAKAPIIGSTEDDSHQEQAPKIGSQDDSHQEQASEMGSEDDIHEEQASEMGSEDDSHEETSTYLSCYKDFRILPRYIKNEEVYSNSHPTK
ncbi:disease resistance protein At4g27190-like [Pistacia vera]|uniref:disease resistance protein At4g27190-like n=1 Tax=Pistacia vera TaxID=55513 RepID=UPI0012639623|nr:disease resistance protein At4g27190-like [Pistacia vera]